MKLDLGTPRTLPAIVRDAGRVYFANALPLFGLALLSIPIQMIVGTIQDRASKDTQSNLIGLFFLPSIFVSMLASSAVVYAAAAAMRDGRAEFGASLDATIARFGAVVSSFGLFLLLTVASLVAFPYFAVRWTFQTQAVMIEGKRNWAALDASSAAVKGRWWQTFAALILLFLPVIPIALVQRASWAEGLLPVTLLGLAFSAIMPYVLTAQTLIYYDLKARKQADVSTDRLPTPE